MIINPNVPESSCFCEDESKVRFELKNSPVDAENYYYCSKRSYLTKPNDRIESVIHFLMCGLGGGLVAIHVAYMKCGLCGALPANVVLSALVGYCVCLLVWSAQKLYGRVQKYELTYPDVMEAAMLLSPWPRFQKLARASRYLVEGTLLCHLYGTCCVLIIMIARNLKELGTGSMTVIDDEDPPIKFIILALTIPCFAISMVTDLKSFAPFALICDLFGAALVMVTIWYSYHENFEDQKKQYQVFKSIPGLIEFSCICIFALEPVCHALSIENSMEEPKRFHFVVLTAMPILTVAMIIVGIFGYYGEYSTAPITVHFPFTIGFAVTLKVFLCISLCAVYTLCFYLGFDLAWFYLRRNHDPTRYWVWERVYRAGFVVALVLIAGSLPINVVSIMGVLGAFSTTPTIFIYPPFIYLLVNWENPGLGRYNFKLVTSVAIMSLGFLLTVFGTYYNIIGIMKSAPQQIEPLRMRQKEFFRRMNSDADLNSTTALAFNLTFNKIDGGTL